MNITETEDQPIADLITAAKAEVRKAREKLLALETVHRKTDDKDQRKYQDQQIRRAKASLSFNLRVLGYYARKAAR